MCDGRVTAIVYGVWKIFPFESMAIPFGTLEGAYSSHHCSQKYVPRAIVTEWCSFDDDYSDAMVCTTHNV